MRLSSKTLSALTEIINGEIPRGYSERLSPYRSLGQITKFFRDFGERDIHPHSGAPSRFSYTSEKLEKFNGSEAMARIICNTLEFWGEDNLNPEHAAAHLNTFLRRDGYELVIEERYIRMNGGRAETEPYFEVRPLRSTVIDTPSLVSLSNSSITEHLAKARMKIDTGDNAGAITNAYTLVEHLLKEILRRTNTPFKADEGNIRELYRLAIGPMNLDPAGEHLESYLKSILQGLKQQATGLYELANKASDRHARRYQPARHHAKLAVNTAFTLCEFLLDSFEYQTQRKGVKVDLEANASNAHH